MGTANRDRQKRWREKQEAAGKKRFTVVVDRDVYDFLQDQKRCTGQTLSGVINSAVRRLAMAQNDILGAAGTAAPPMGTERGIDEARSMIRRLLTLGKG